MQFGKLFVVFGRLHSEDDAVYCTASVRNAVDCSAKLLNVNLTKNV
jgi:hypothetical protein